VSRTQLRLDLHVHTVHSFDGFTTLEEAVFAAKGKRLDGLAITDHDVTTITADQSCHEQGVILIPGTEVSTRCGHVLALGVFQPIPKGLPIEESIERIHGLNGVAVAAHPFSILHGLGWKRESVELVDAIEVINANSHLFTYQTGRSRRLAKSLQKPMTAGSDSHIPRTVGNAYTIVEAEGTSLDALLKAILQGKTRPTGTSTSIFDKLGGTALRIKNRFLTGKGSKLC
jgi:predicted metal-dependent phosphoesterase TrpH